MILTCYKFGLTYMSSLDIFCSVELNMKHDRNWYESHGLKQKQQVGFSLRGLQLIKTLTSCYCYDKPVYIYFTNGL